MCDLVIIACVMAILLMVLTGCAKQAPAIQRALDANALASTEQARAGAHIEVVRMGLGQLKPYVVDNGKALLAAVGDYAAKAAEANAAQASAIAAERTAIIGVGVELETEKTARKTLEAKWYVRLGRWLEKLFWIIVFSWLALGVLSIVFGMGNPLSWTWRIGKEITRLVPAMNVFSWLRDWMLARKKRRASK